MELEDVRYEVEWLPSGSWFYPVTVCCERGYESLCLIKDRKPPFYFFHHATTALLGRGLLIIEDSWSHSVRHSTLNRTPLDEWLARRRGLYLTTHKTYKRQTSMPPMGFENKIPARELPHTHALDHSATGIGKHLVYAIQYKFQGLEFN